MKAKVIETGEIIEVKSLYSPTYSRLDCNGKIIEEYDEDELIFLNTSGVKELNLEKENLTWKDIRELYIIFAEIDVEIEFCKTDIQGETIGYYQEALRRFKEKIVK